MSYKTLKLACYTTNISMSAISSLSPLLFVTFRSLYGISYSLLGFLVVINFATQLLVDLIFSFFSHKFNIQKVVRYTPILTFVGLLVYALYPFLFPESVYVGLVVGTVLFAVSGGLCEVLISPVIASIPADDPDREMSKLHSVYAWGVVAIVIFSTLFLALFGSASWQYLALLFALIPIFALIMFGVSKIPDLGAGGEKRSARTALEFLKNKKMLLCIVVMFISGAAESVMSQWCSGYLEQAFKIDKVWGDIFGMALFAAMLGLGRTLYAKRGKNIYRVLMLGIVGATACYLISVFFFVPIVGLLACAMTGLCVSMLWPGNLIVASERISGDVFVYAIMAAAGDCGGALAPQIVGIVSDLSLESPLVGELAANLSVSVEQLCMRLGILAGTFFPLIGIFFFAVMVKKFKKKA